MLLHAESSQASCYIFSLLALFLMKGNLYSVRDLDEKLTETFQEFYQEKEEILKMFSNSDFYEIKINISSLPFEINQLICNYITSSASTDFNIFIKIMSNLAKFTCVPDNLYFFTLTKQFEKDFVFGIKCKNGCDQTLSYKQKKIFLHEKHLKYLLNCLFNVALIFRKFYSDLIRTDNFSYIRRFAYCRFMIFDSEFNINNIIGLPDKKLKCRLKHLVCRPKPVTSTKIRLSGKLPGSLPIDNIDTILKNSFDMFSNIHDFYRIKAAWRFENNLLEIDDCGKFSLKTFSTDFIRILFNKKYVLNNRVLYIKKYSGSCTFNSEGSIELPGYMKRILINISWDIKPYYIQLYHKEDLECIKKYVLNFSTPHNDEVEFEILSNNNLNITKIVETSKRKVIFLDFIGPLNYEHKIKKILNIVTRWL